jgi:ATP-dependent Clp protease adaptor protein ClpS
MRSMAGPVTAPERTRDVDAGDTWKPEKPWLVVVHNDPINLMSYVTWVFQKLFGYPRAKAHKLMMDVHTKGRAVVASGPREKAEADCFRLHAHGLWATLTRSE